MSWQKKALTDLVVILFIGSFIGFLAPFGMDAIALHIRISFWILICGVGFVIYKPCIRFIEVKLKDSKLPYLVRIGLSTTLASIPTTFVLVAVNMLFFGIDNNWFDEAIRLLPKVLLIGLMISAVSILKNTAEDQKQALEASQKDKQQLENKLSKDHLILMRFKDALALLEHTAGLQVHRSWWIAIDAVKQVEKKDRKWQLRLSNDELVPVSKTYLSDVKAAGIK